LLIGGLVLLWLASIGVIVVWGLKRELVLLALAAVVIVGVTYAGAHALSFIADNVPIVGGALALTLLLGGLLALSRRWGPRDGGFTLVIDLGRRGISEALSDTAAAGSRSLSRVDQSPRSSEPRDSRRFRMSRSDRTDLCRGPF
jgi:hypothetical protein